MLNLCVFFNQIEVKTTDLSLSLDYTWRNKTLYSRSGIYWYCKWKLWA